MRFHYKEEAEKYDQDNGYNNFGRRAPPLYRLTRLCF